MSQKKQMNIAVYSSSLNGKDALKSCVQLLLKQIYPIKEIIIVDNRSSDDTCLEVFPESVTMICHLRNLGTSGAVATAFEYSLTRGYDWLWVLDQDTIPKPDALQKIVDLYQNFDTKLQSQIGIISSTVILKPSDIVVHGRQLTTGGVRPTKVDEDQVYYECDATIWSGSMYNLHAVKKVGLPSFGINGCWENLSLDYGDLEYSFRIKRAGYKVLGHNLSHIIHPVGTTKYLKFLSLKIYSTNHSPFRRYLYFRNMVYFWLYIFDKRKLSITLFYLACRLIANSIKIIIMENNRTNKILACLIGVWDGLNKNLHHRHFYKT